MTQLKLALSARALIVSVALVGGLFITTAHAQTEDASTMRARGEALVYGINGETQDIAQGLTLLGQAADAGDSGAQAALGKILLDGYYTEANPERALQLLESAAATGNAMAQAELGKALLWGLSIRKDEKRAEALLRSAANAGYVDARRFLGVELIGGWEFDRNVDLGLAMLEEAALENDEAQVDLGTFLLYGEYLPKNRARALELFEQAAEAGNGAGLETYGTDLMWSLRDPSAAEDYLRRAAELGRPSAWSVLAEGAMYGYFGLDGTSRRRFEEFAAAARAAGDRQIEVLDAKRRMWGISMRASGPLTLQKLAAAADEGNPEAAKFLISLLRDGNHLNIRRDRGSAREALSRYAAIMKPREVRQYELTISASGAGSLEALAKWAEDFNRHVSEYPGDLTQQFAEELHKANPNAVIYLLQKRLRETASFRGRLDGYAGRKTIAALNRACVDLGIGEKCDDSVLRSDVLSALLARL